MDHKQMLDRVDEKLLECIDKAERHYGRNFEVPRLVYRKMGRCAGQASVFRNTIELSTDFLREYPEDMINDTIPHEFAHIVADKTASRRVGHSAPWKQCMRVFGLAPERCHSYDIAKVSPGGNYMYKCKCGEFPFSKRRHNQVRRGKLYTCRKCKAKLEFTGEVK